MWFDGCYPMILSIRMAYTGKNMSSNVSVFSTVLVLSCTSPNTSTIKQTSQARIIISIWKGADVSSHKTKVLW